MKLKVKTPDLTLPRVLNKVEGVERRCGPHDLFAGELIDGGNLVDGTRLAVVVAEDSLGREYFKCLGGILNGPDGRPVIADAIPDSVNRLPMMDALWAHWCRETVEHNVIRRIPKLYEVIITDAPDETGHIVERPEAQRILAVREKHGFKAERLSRKEREFIRERFDGAMPMMLSIEADKLMLISQALERLGRQLPTFAGSSVWAEVRNVLWRAIRSGKITLSGPSIEIGVFSAELFAIALQIGELSKDEEPNTPSRPLA